MKEQKFAPHPDSIGFEEEEGFRAELIAFLAGLIARIIPEKNAQPPRKRPPSVFFDL